MTEELLYANTLKLIDPGKLASGEIHTIKPFFPMGNFTFKKSKQFFRGMGTEDYIGEKLVSDSHKNKLVVNDSK